MSKYVGCGLYVDQWTVSDEKQGNLKRNIFDLMYGPEVQYATAKNPQKYYGTYATYVDIEEDRDV